MFFAEAIRRLEKAAKKPAKAAAKPKVAAKPAAKPAKAKPRAATPAEDGKGPNRVPAGDGSGRGGQFAPKNFAAVIRETPYKNSAGKDTKVPANATPFNGSKIGEKSNKRAFNGVQAPGKALGGVGSAGGQVAHGDVAEAFGLDWIKKHVSGDAIPLKQMGLPDNFPFDAAAYVQGKGVRLYEMKGGQPQNAPGAQQWRVTVNQNLSKTFKPVFDKMTPAQQKTFRAGQLQEAMDRKENARVAIEKHLRTKGLIGKNERVEAYTLAMIYDSNTKLADIHEIPGLHLRMGWKDPVVTDHYKGSFKLTIAKAMAEDATVKAALKAWGDEYEAEILASLDDLAAAIAAMQGKDTIAKVDVLEVVEDQRYIAGWASVIEKDGEVVTDRQGDTIDEAEMIQAAHDFMRHHRVGKAMHKGDADQVEYTESMVFTKDVQKALGIDLGKVGWWLGGFASPETFALVKSGKLKGLSVGGVAVRHTD